MEGKNEEQEEEVESDLIRFTDPDEPEEDYGEFGMGHDGGIDDLLDGEEEYDTESESEYIDEQERERALKMLQEHNTNS